MCSNSVVVVAAGGWQPDNTRELVMRIVGTVSWAQFSDASTTLPGQQLGLTSNLSPLPLVRWAGVAAPRPISAQHLCDGGDSWRPGGERSSSFGGSGRPVVGARRVLELCCSRGEDYTRHCPHWGSLHQPCDDQHPPVADEARARPRWQLGEEHELLISP